MISLNGFLIIISYLHTIHIFRIQNIHTSANDLNKDLEMIHKCAFQWKMNFNPDPAKQIQEVIFSRKTKKTTKFFLSV